ncbi:MAG: hypothetical protein UT32_C0025G0007 [Parcubacteria group bacterium GW2011_GWC2_39_14]|nr:MAG: hypothetical protein UT32_C0025G0007 [Parcubacteria group bacterium GW2011_GWC2_39_14]
MPPETGNQQNQKEAEEAALDALDFPDLKERHDQLKREETARDRREKLLKGIREIEGKREAVEQAEAEKIRRGLVVEQNRADFGVEMEEREQEILAELATKEFVVDTKSFGDTGLFLDIYTEPDVQPGDLIKIDISDDEGEKVIDFWRDLVPPGTRLVAGSDDKVPEYDELNDAVIVPVLNPRFAKRAPKQMLGVLHALGHARRKHEADEQAARSAEVVEFAAYEHFIKKDSTPEDQKNFEKAQKEAREKRKVSEQKAWDEAFGVIAEVHADKAVDLIPGFGEWPDDGSGKKAEALLFAQEAMKKSSKEGGLDKSLKSKARRIFKNSPRTLGGILAWLAVAGVVFVESFNAAKGWLFEKIDSSGPPKKR